MATLPKDPEKSVTIKPDVSEWLRKSQEAVKAGYQSADRQKKVQFFGKDGEVLQDAEFHARSDPHSQNVSGE